MITIWVPKRLVEIDLYNVAAQSPAALAEMSEKSYRQRVAYAAQKIRDSRAKIVMLTGPSASGKTTSAHKVAEALEASGTPAHVISLDNFFKGAQYYPRLPDGTLDYENPDTLDMPLIRQCLSDLSTTGKTVLPIYDFTTESRSSETETLDLKGGVCIVEGIHALNPELTGLVKGDDVYRIYAGLREEYCIDGRRVINTQDIRLCRRTLRDAAARGRSPPAPSRRMWDRVLDGETRYIKGLQATADFLLDTSFTYELGLISKLLGVVRRQFTLEGHNAELWDETARRFEHVHRWSWSCCRKTACCGNSMAAQPTAGHRMPMCENYRVNLGRMRKKLFPNRHQTVKNAARSLQTSGLCAIMEITSAHGQR